ncbi:MAG: hypothetical protein ACRDQD_30515, partial [Nocardioidaceae bacterium]
PLAWAVLLLFHPTGDEDDYYSAVEGNVDRWLVVHLGMMIFIPLMTVTIILLVRGIDNTAARICRIASAVFALFYVAWEVLLGIGTPSSSKTSMGSPPTSGPPGRTWSTSSPRTSSSATSASSSRSGTLH